MANGSFGLSGFPTAPTTTSGASGGDTNPFTPISVAVNSTAGFQAGDLVYNFGGDIQPVPDNYVSSATFPISVDAMAYTQNVNYGEMQFPPVTTGYNGRGVSYAEKLTDGNIVIVYERTSYQSGDGYPYFKVIDENGTTIVTDTLISTNPTDYGQVAVCALSGGGFVVAWQHSNRPYYAIYANPSGGSCAVVKAATMESITINQYSWLQVAARPDGSWIYLTQDNTNNLKHKIFTNAGVQIYNWTTSVPITSFQNYYFLVVRSDNTFVIFNTQGSNYVQYICYTSTNTVAKTVAVVSSLGVSPTYVWGGATVLSDGNILLTYSNVNYLYRNTINASNVVSATETYNITAGTSFVSPIPKALSSGNYLLNYTQSTSTDTEPVSQITSFAIFNNSHVIQSTAGGNNITAMPSAPIFTRSIVETTNFLHIFQTPQGNGTTAGNYTSIYAPRFMQWVKISPTTFQTTKTNSVSSVVGNSAAQPVSGYAKGSSTPSSAAFFAGASGTITTSTSKGAVVKSQTTIDTAETCEAHDSAPLSDGSCLIYYRGNTSYVTKIVVVSSDGALGTPITLATGLTTTSYVGFHRLAVLSNGKIAVTYVNASTQLVLSILTSVYAIESTLIIPSGVSVQNSGRSVGIAALSGGRFVLTYGDSNNYIRYRVYDSSLTQLVGDTNVYSSGSSNYGTSVAGLPNGFIISFQNGSSGSNNSFAFEEYSTNAFAVSGSASYGGNSYNSNHKIITTPSGDVFDPYVQNTTSLGRAAFFGGGNNAVYSNTQMTGISNVNTSGGLTGTVTASGVVAMFSWQSTSQTYLWLSSAGNGAQASQSVPAATLTVSQPAVGQTFYSSAPLRGNNVVLVLPDASNRLSYLVVNTFGITYSASLTAGVTPSNPVAISPTNGFSLVGVSSTDAPANGSGTVVINGPAQLNSSYPSTTPGQSFDFGNPVTFGAAGTISGRNVNLIGNV